MANQAIENLTIENFKCFKQLEVNNIGRVNLIGGKNNVGKTAFLEAVELFVSSNRAFDLFNLVQRILKRRQNKDRFNIEMDFVYNGESEIKLLSNDNSKECVLKRSFDVIKSDEINYDGNEELLPTEIITASVNEDKKSIPERRLLSSRFFVETKNYLNYISSSKTDEQDIAILFGVLTDLKKEGFLNESLSLFDSSILELKLIPKEKGIVLKLEIKNKESLVLLSSLGEGINRYIAILCAIWASKDSVLLIDEIENGIHYTNYKKLWQIIFQSSIDANCQLFITTHSKECISAFNEVQFENENCNAQYFEFYKNLKTDLIKASAITKERLQYSLTHEGRIRGE